MAYSPSNVVQPEDFFVTAILVTHDGAQWLPQVIASLFSQTRKIDRIISVDTGSIDSSAKLVRAAGIPLVEAERDLGYGDAIEIALENAPPLHDDGAENQELLWLLHDDCAPAHDALEILLKELAQRPQVAIAGPKLLGWYDRDHILEVGISIANTGSRWTGLETREQDQGQEDYTREVLSVSTAAMIVRRAAFIELGGLDPNLALFRDDVDLGWRAHVAGFGAVCVGEASVFHAQASATERRPVDVSEAFLRRPLLLDRRNAAYVLLVNSSWWMLPLLTIQLLGTSLLRAFFNLFAKLPGYAGDEIAAIGLLLIHPGELVSARRSRRKKRLLSSRVIKRFIPPRGSQIRAGYDQLLWALSKSFRFNQRTSKNAESLEQSPIQSRNYSSLEVLDDELENLDLSAPISASLIRQFFKKPEIFTLSALIVISLVAGRERFGNLSGGALAHLQDSGLELFKSYESSWHAIGMGTSNPSPMWMALLSVVSIFTLGNLPLLISLIFFVAPPLSFYLFVRVLKKLGLRNNFAVIGSLIYVLNPLMWSALNQGRIDVLILFFLLPSILLVDVVIMKVEMIVGSSWRRVFATSLLVVTIGAFSPLLLITWVLVQLYLLTRHIIDFIRQKDQKDIAPLFDILESSHFVPISKRLTLLASTILLLMPWSLFALMHPSQWLAAPGVPLTNGGAPALIALTTGGAGSTPLWLVSPIAVVALSAFFIRSLTSAFFKFSLLLTIALLLNSLHVEMHGATTRVWSQDLILVAALVLIPPFMFQAQEIIPRLRQSRVGLPHILSACATSLIIASCLATTVWVSTSANKSLVRGNQEAVVPAFVSALGDTPAKPKTLVLGSDGSGTSFFITRGSELQLGDADVAAHLPSQIQSALDQLVSGSGVTSSKVLGMYGITYLFVKAPVPTALASTINGIGGFAQVSSTPAGEVWKVVAANPRVLLITPSNKRISLDSSDLGVSDLLTSSGKIILSERYASNWKLLLDGQSVPAIRDISNLTEFNIPHSGNILISFDGTAHRALLSLEFLTILVAVVMALPSGRRKVEVPLEELV